jgi:hypothetical protein
MQLSKKVIFIFYAVIFFTAILFVLFFLVYSKDEPLNISEVSDNEIVLLLEKNKDCSDYIKKYSDFKIQDKTILTKDSIIVGQNGQNFKEVYQGLELEDNRYMKVDLMNLNGDRGMITVIDFKTKQVPKAYGVMLFKLNGQATSQK